MWLRFLNFPLALFGGLLAAALCVAGLVAALAYPNLPLLDTLTDDQPKMPLRVYTIEGELNGEFGEERRVLVDIKDVPAALTNAIIAAEDERFYQHAGIDYIGVGRAAFANLVTGGRRQGASTITMQVARNFFLSSEKTLTRKLYEVLLAIKIERNLSKDRILGLGGADSLDGGRGADCIDGGPDNDTINVGSLASATNGNVNSISASLIINGDAGNDLLYGADGADILDSRDSKANDANIGGLETDTCLKDAGDTAFEC